MTESKTDLQAQPIVVHCPFCLSENKVHSFTERCWNCGLELARLLPQEMAGVERAVQPVQIAPEQSTPETDAGTRTPRKMRLTKRQRQKREALERHRQKRDALERHESARWFLAAPEVPPRHDPPSVVAPPSFAAPPHFVQPAQPATPEFFSPAAPDPDMVFENGDETEYVFDATIVAPRAGVATQWALELEDGSVAWLVGEDVVVGRRPYATGDATPVAISDTTKTLSRSHARFRRDATSDTWTIEDIGSANGVATVDPQGGMTPLLPGVPAQATDYLQLGTLRMRLTRVAYPNG